MKKKVHAAITKHIARDIVIEKPKERSFGHFATPIAFSLAKEYKKSPIAIADELCTLLACEPIFEKVEAVKGYINFRLSEEFMNEYATWALANEELFGRDKKNESILLEFVSANPTGPLHIGHARGAVLGDVLLRVGRHLGYKITSEYYINDAGNQIYLLGLSIFLSGKEAILGEEVVWPEQYYRGEYILDLARKAAEVFGPQIFADESAIPRLSEWGKDEMMEVIRSDLAAAGIVFDNFVSEKEISQGWPAVFEKLEKNGAIYALEGKLWLKSTERGDEKDRVVVREDGRATYLAGDIVYHDDKFARGYDRYINIWGADHHGYIARVKAAVGFLGYDEQRLEVLLSQMVSLLKGGEPYRMSKRAGNFILMSDVLEEIGPDALRLIFISKKSDTPLEFDVEDLKKEDASNPIYYINYAHARVHSVFAKAGRQTDEVKDVSLCGLDDEAKDLLFLALLLPEVIEDAFLTRQFQKITDYLKNLSAAFHKFYNEHRVIGSQNEEKLLKLFAVVALSIRVGLRLLGIEAKKRM